MLYFNRYVNCGDGVFEYTTLRHNNVGSAPESFGYINVPWGGTRNTVLKDIVLSNVDGLDSSPVHPLPDWGAGTNSLLDNTGGFTVFAEDLLKPAGANHDNIYDNDALYPAGMVLTVNGDCYISGARFICPVTSSGAATVNSLPSKGLGALYVRLKGSTSGENSVVVSINHWNYNNGGKMYFYKEDQTLDQVKAALPTGSVIEVYYWEPGSGKPADDNLALGHVHGNASSTVSLARANYPRVRYGKAGRDYNVYTINSIPNIQSGDSYYFRQYFMMGELNGMNNTGTTYSPAVEENQYAAGARTGRVVKLYSDGSNKFGFALGSDSCGSSAGPSVCQGTTTPQTNSKALFQVQCGSSYVVSEDPYHFTPEPDDPTNPATRAWRSYVCVVDEIELTGIRPVWTLLGFFNSADCSVISTDYQYDETYCAQSPAEVSILR